MKKMNILKPNEEKYFYDLFVLWLIFYRISLDDTGKGSGKKIF